MAESFISIAGVVSATSQVTVAVFSAATSVIRAIALNNSSTATTTVDIMVVKASDNSAFFVYRSPVLSSTASQYPQSGPIVLSPSDELVIQPGHADQVHFVLSLLKIE